MIAIQSNERIARSTQNWTRLHMPDWPFHHPSNLYRPWPLFSLNGDYSSPESVQALTTALSDLKSAGFGGVYLHPRPGLLTEYLSPQWFQLIETLIHACVDMELVPALYDENSYPSGHAGGHVTADAPELQAFHVVPVYGQGTPLPKGFLCAREWKQGLPGTTIETAQPDQAWVAFCMREAFIAEWHGRQPTASLLHPGTAERFLQKTHAAYRRNLSANAWQQLASIFTDEPHLIADQHGIEGQGLPLTPYLSQAFRERWGYALEPCLPSLFFDVDDFQRVRFHYYELCHDLFRESWAKPLARWTQANGIRLTGHYLEHDWPVPYATPGQMELLAEMDWPGTDQLLGFPLAGHDQHDIQNHPPSPPGSEPHLLYYLRQAASVANQLGKDRVMNECWGASSHASDPSDWYRIGTYLLVNGVNHLVPHHCMPDFRGTRKHDHPPFFSQQSPWFPSIRPLIDELSRIAQAVTAGRVENRVLILDAQTTGFLLAAKGRASDPENSEIISIDKQGPLRQLRESIVGLVESLAWAQIDFDIGDEYLLQAHGSISADGGLCVGRQTYTLLVWPPGMIHLRSASMERLDAYLRKGGQIAGPLPDRIRVDGETSNQLDKWLHAYPSQITRIDPAELVAFIQKRIPPRLQVTGKNNGCLHLRKVQPGQTTWLLVNSAPETRVFTFPTEARDVSKAYEIDLADGQATRLPDEFNADGSLPLNPVSARLLIFSDPQPELKAVAPQKIRSSTSGEALNPVQIERSEAAVLAVDCCQLRTGSKDHGTWETRQANRLLWSRHGLCPDGWSRTIQYCQDVRKRAVASGRTEPIELRYRFEIGEGVDTSGFQIAIEQPWHGAAFINSSVLDGSQSETWLDPSLLRFNVGEHLRAGSNELLLKQAGFDVHCEVATIYILGDFSLEPIEPGFRIVSPTPLGLGSWKAQGLPFYDRTVCYQFQTPTAGTLVIDPPDWRGSWLEVTGQEGRAHAWPGRTLSIDADAPTLWEVRVTGLPWNLFGPWHRKQVDPFKFTNPSDWNPSVAEIQPQPGSAYIFMDLGLRTRPQFHQTSGKSSHGID